MAQPRRNQKNSPRIFVAKSSKPSPSKKILIIFLLFFVFAQCSSKKKNPPRDPREPLKISESADGPLYQLTFQGENKDLFYSKELNRLIWSRAPEGKTYQLYELDLQKNLERRLTYNLGDNLTPSLHSQKKWIAYSSSKDKKIEEIPIQDLMAEYGLHKEEISPQLERQDIYIRSLDGNDIERITKNKKHNIKPLFSSNGDKIYYISQAPKNFQIIEVLLKTGKKRVFYSNNQEILDFYLNDSHIAILSQDEGSVFQIQVLDLATMKTPLFSYQTSKPIQSLHLNATSSLLLIEAQWGEENNSDIYQIHMEEGCKVRLTKDKAQDMSPVYGGADHVILFASNRQGSFQIYTKNLDPKLPCEKLEIHP